MPTLICPPTSQVDIPAARGFGPVELAALVADVSGSLKLQRVLPDDLVEEILVRPLRDDAAVANLVGEPIDQVVVA